MQRHDRSRASESNLPQRERNADSQIWLDRPLNRYQDNPFSFMSPRSHEHGSHGIPRNQYLAGYTHISEAERDEALRKLMHVHMMNYALKKFKVPSIKKDIIGIVNKSLENTANGTPAKPDEIKLAREYLEKYDQQSDVDSLIRLYTLETPLYSALQNDCDSYAIELYRKIKDLSERAFKGKSYRGLTLSQEDIGTYEWSMRNDETGLIKIKTFSSTSMEEKIAILMAEKHAAYNPNKFCVLFQLNFPDPCYTAIRLDEIPDKKLHSLVRYGTEKEVLLLPGTFFKVKSIRAHEPNPKWYTIVLENVSIPLTTLEAAVKEFEDI